MKVFVYSFNLKSNFELGRLGGQVKYTGLKGEWKILTDDVNTMAANLSSQFSAIAEVMTKRVDHN